MRERLWNSPSKPMTREGAKGHSPRPFDADGDLNALAAEQDVKPADDFDALHRDFWPEDEGVDDFVTALRGWRREPEAFSARMR